MEMYSKYLTKARGISKQGIFKSALSMSDSQGNELKIVEGINDRIK